ncbi:predicted protein [Naegleria gruberi]|uniref:Predicted protein n=1 Tax=Naegleria gruberi TaxID=5762 RepID=D2VM19_NAEGR|nr:uncharacterized protein NAEGRDRAFT_58644 [Naegleria gruberi]EFC42245.1 predicted protein [Naegleria gruberi]|eukprot:XP_002674989.1 predicted protein [Naegleria gruberi strain NEG-M]
MMQSIDAATTPIHYKLVKQGEVKKSGMLSWKKTLISLNSHPNSLSILSSDGKERKSTLILDSAHTITNLEFTKKHPFCFYVKSHIEGKKKEEEWTFECSSKEEAEEWIESIKKLIGKGSANTSNSNMVITVKQPNDNVVETVKPQTSATIQSSSSTISAVASSSVVSEEKSSPKKEEKIEDVKKVKNEELEEIQPAEIEPLEAEMEPEELEEEEPIKLESAVVRNVKDEQVSKVTPLLTSTARLESDSDEEEDIIVTKKASNKNVKQASPVKTSKPTSTAPVKSKTSVLKDDSDSDDDGKIVSKKVTSNPRPTATASGGPPNKKKTTVLKDDDSDEEEEIKSDKKAPTKTLKLDEDEDEPVISSATNKKPSTSGPRSKKTVLKDESDEEEEEEIQTKKPSFTKSDSKPNLKTKVEYSLVDPSFDYSPLPPSGGEEDEPIEDEDDEIPKIDDISQLIEELEYNSQSHKRALNAAKYLYERYKKDAASLVEDIVSNEGLQACVCMLNDNTRSYSICLIGLLICNNILVTKSGNNEPAKAMMRLTGLVNSLHKIINEHYLKFKLFNANNLPNNSNAPINNFENVTVISLSLQLLGLLCERPNEQLNELISQKQLDFIIKYCEEVMTTLYTQKEYLYLFDLSRSLFNLLNNICLHNLESLKNMSKRLLAFDVIVKYLVYFYGNGHLSFTSIAPSQAFLLLGNNFDDFKLNMMNCELNVILIPFTKFVALTAKESTAKAEMTKIMVTQGGVTSLLTNSSGNNQYVTKIFSELSDSPLVLKSFKNLLQLNLKNKETVTNILTILNVIYRNRNDKDKLIEILASDFNSIFFSILSKYPEEGWILSYCVEFLNDIEKNYPDSLNKGWNDISMDEQADRNVYTNVRVLILSFGFGDPELQEMVLSLFTKHLNHNKETAGTQFASTFGFHVALLDIVTKNSSKNTTLTMALNLLLEIMPFTQFKETEEQALVQNLITYDLREKIISTLVQKLKDTSIDKSVCTIISNILHSICVHYDVIKLSIDDMKIIVKAVQSYILTDNELAVSILLLFSKIAQNYMSQVDKSGALELCRKILQTDSKQVKEIKDQVKNLSK